MDSLCQGRWVGVVERCQQEHRTSQRCARMSGCAAIALSSSSSSSSSSSFSSLLKPLRVEAREVGKHSVKILSGGMTSSQVNRVQGPEQGICKFCGTRGHGKNPIRRTDCPAFGKRYKECQLKGHFPNMCLKKGTNKGDPPKDTSKTSAKELTQSS